MSIDVALFSRLTGHAGLSALIGTRAFPGALPQSTSYPALVYARAGGARHQAMGAYTGLSSLRYQVDVWASTAASLHAVRAQVLAALDRWRQSGPPVVQDTYCTVLFETVEDAPRSDGKSTLLHRGTIEAVIHVEES